MVSWTSRWDGACCACITGWECAQRTCKVERWWFHRGNILKGVDWKVKGGGFGDGPRDTARTPLILCELKGCGFADAQVERCVLCVRYWLGAACSCAQRTCIGERWRFHRRDCFKGCGFGDERRRFQGRTAGHGQNAADPLRTAHPAPCVWSLGFGVWGGWVLGFGFWVLGFGVWGLRFGWDFGLGVWGLGLKVHGVSFRSQGLELWVYRVVFSPAELSSRFENNGFAVM